MATTALELRQTADSPVASARKEITYFYGIRGLSSIYILYFHLNNIILAAHFGAVVPLYARLTDWIRFGDFRVSAFFVISGYLLTLPTQKTPDWRLSQGIRGFLARRVERLIYPYYVALALSIVLFVAWRLVIAAPLNITGLIYGTIVHVLLVHNLDPRTNLYINDTLWNIALEFQCYLLFVAVFLPVMRRFGPWAQLAVAAAIGLGPHFFFHGFLDWTRPWFITLYGMGVAAAALGNRAYPRLQKLERSVPWGTLWLVTSLASVVAIVRSGIDTSYGDGWLQNILLGLAISALLVYTATGMRGAVAVIARPVIRLFENTFLCKLGRFSYSTYLIQFPILRLAVALTALVTSSIWVTSALAFFVYAPLTFVVAYGFHVCFERPYQNRRLMLAGPAQC